MGSVASLSRSFAVGSNKTMGNGSCIDYDKETQPRFKRYIQETFRQEAFSVNQKDFEAIEFLIRKGRKQLELLANESVKDIHQRRYKCRYIHERLDDLP
jgi:hypothetical protein